MNTYEFVAEWAAKKRPKRVLDYGCGAGQIVQRLRDRGIEAWGCDVFYEGGDSSSNIPAALKPFILRMTPAIPFGDGSFDLVLSNQVLEHVPDLDTALREIARVLKPGGMALNVFPDRGVWYEGHCGVPFLHWFPKGTGPRIYYALFFRMLGLGYFTKGKTRIGWARDFCDWLDKWTYYRARAEILDRCGQILGPTHLEDEKWFSAKFEGRLDFLPLALRLFVVRKIAGAVVVSERTRK